MNKILKKLIEIIEHLKESGVKPWYYSKTLWLDILALAAIIVQLKTGFVVDPAEQLAIITIANLILRLITGKELKIKNGN